jgi:Z1 domain
MSAAGVGLADRKRISNGHVAADVLVHGRRERCCPRHPQITLKVLTALQDALFPYNLTGAEGKIAMATDFDISRFRSDKTQPIQFNAQLERLKNASQQTSCIEEAVSEAEKNISERNCRSFVIYGEPQSGKTEMMICLTAKLLDMGYDFIIHMLNDSVDLLSQNLGRFKSSGLAPSARNFSEILDPEYGLKGQKHVIFCKKNGSDLAKLIDKLAGITRLVVVDDEADFASPNAKVNKGQKTRINHLIEEILGDSGVYIGVTATPARLDLNNTFDNDNELWVNFPPHDLYTGQDVFFPIDVKPRHQLTLLQDKGDDPKYARNALFSFLVNVAHHNLFSGKKPQNFSMLVHTSGKKAEHGKDWKEITKSLEMLNNQTSAKFESYVKAIWEIANKRYQVGSADALTHYILDNISKNSVMVINSDKDKSVTDGTASNPSSLFTIIIGGNIVSRGVTFNYLLSMYFTRDVKHKIQQDTYIQRARMFGSRGEYLDYFELTIPEELYLDWHRCFVFHKLALAAIKAKLGSPVWLGDTRIQTVASSSIDRSTVDLDKGEMRWGLFPFSKDMTSLLESSDDGIRMIERISELTEGAAIPRYLVDFMRRMSTSGSPSIHIRKPSSIHGYRDADHEKIERKKGLMGQIARDGNGALHHFGIFFNEKNIARVYYKFNGSIQFIKNLKHG